MGSVFLAEAPSGRLVAVKVIRAEFAHEEQFRARFRSEVSRAREVPPFCTAEVLDADPDHATPYLVVEYVDGPSLSEVVAESGPLSGGSLHGVAVGVAAALAAIHGVGVIHRDLKPRNVLFALGTPKVIDFGIARPLEPTSFHTRAEEVVGTLAYMAPERLDPETDRLVTPAADVFAWAAVVTYAGTGRTPFGGDSPAVTAARILTQPPRVVGLPPYLTELVISALAKEPADRPTAPELLDRLLVSGAPSAPPLPPELRRDAEAAQQSGRYQTGGHRPRPARRAITIAAAAVVTLAAATTAGVVLQTQSQTQEGTHGAGAAATAKPVTGPAMFDSLRSETLFVASSDESGTCGYRRGLRVTAKASATEMCGDYLDTVFPTSQNISVRATAANADSCPAIWFRASARQDNRENYLADFYRVAVCPGEVSLTSSIGGAENVIATAKRSTATGAGHTVQLVADEGEATVSVDGAEALRGRLTESSLVSGRVLVGAVAGAGGRADVTFTDLRLRSGTDPAVPATPAFTTGDARFTAGQWMLSDREKVAILEPTEYLSGAEYCRRFPPDDTSPNCTKKYVPVPNAVKVSLPVATGITYLDYRKDPKKCTDPATHAGTCRVAFDAFTTNSGGDGSPTEPLLVTIRAGKIVTAARLNLE
ncbi:hypothetical protein Ate02nite_64580 [Paractinoplanes tereljensis]|uniref:Protein kinase domain-containing protein n=2 Tax=Paractinoplanes tereljensis TaxID=571912 RepID=A0A919NSV7_9ACTN|nr:hypothetical protein Ate02nite_64580 [Actinoplanes tereljensis]